MREELAEYFLEKNKKDKNLFFLTADLVPNIFYKKKSKNFLNLGVSEQFMTGFAAGLAKQNKKVIIYSIANFSLYRNYEFIRNDICYQNLPVVIIGMGAGSAYHNLGPTHTSLEDISVAKSIPNLNIYSPSGVTEMKELMDYVLYKSKKPSYIRIGKAEKDILKKKFNFNKIKKIRNGESSLCIICVGLQYQKAFQLSEIIKKIFTLNATIFHISTIKPFNVNDLIKKLGKFKVIISLDDNNINGITKEIKFLKYYFKNKKFFFYSYPDDFAYEYSSIDNLEVKYHLDNKKIINDIKKIL